MVRGKSNMDSLNGFIDDSIHDGLAYIVSECAVVIDGVKKRRCNSCEAQVSTPCREVYSE